MNRPMRDKKGRNSIDEIQTVRHHRLADKKRSRNNGRVGILGVSYDGWLSAVATINRRRPCRTRRQCLLRCLHRLHYTVIRSSDEYAPCERDIADQVSVIGACGRKP